MEIEKTDLYLKGRLLTWSLTGRLPKEEIDWKISSKEPAPGDRSGPMFSLFEMLELILSDLN